MLNKLNLFFFTKRVMDVSLSTSMILIFFPVFVIISLMVVTTSRGGVFYKGVRAGKSNISFKIYKFRTMFKDAENMGGYSTAINDHRLTTIGRFLRKYKLDELPQFFNVLIGDMSLVGPRPQVLYYTKQYNKEEYKMLSIRPGITDLSSLYFSDMDKILGSNNVDKKYEKEIEPLKNKLRLKYVESMSIILDIRILLETFFNLFGVKNITNLNLTSE